MLDDISFSLPLTGIVKYSGAVLAGLFLGMTLSRSGLSSVKDVTESLKLQNTRILKTLVTALLTAVLLMPFFARMYGLPEAVNALPGLNKVTFLPSPVSGGFWQSIFAGALAGTGLFLSGRTLLSSFAAVGKGELHALWFIAGAGGVIWLFDECDILLHKKIAKFDFAAGSLPAGTGWDFFDPQMPSFWVTVFIAGVLLMIYFSSLFKSKGDK